jgi:hypothetical protein
MDDFFYVLEYRNAPMGPGRAEFFRKGEYQQNY